MIAQPELGLTKDDMKIVKNAFEKYGSDQKDVEGYILKFINSNGPKEYGIVAYPNKKRDNSPTFYLDQTRIIWRNSKENIGRDLTAQAEIKIKEWKYVKEIK